MSSEKSEDPAGCLLILLVAAVWAEHLPLLCAFGFFALWYVSTITKKRLATDPSAQGLFFRSAISAVEAAGTTAWWAAIGCCLVWLIQIILLLWPNPDSETIGLAEIRFVDAVTALGKVVTLPHFALLMAGALILSMVIGALWPIGGAHYLKKVIGAIVTIGTAMSCFTFVGVNATDARYEQARSGIRAEIGQTLADLAERRREAASYHWLTAQIEQDLAPSSGLADRWKSYLRAPLQTCQKNEKIYQSFYTGDVDYYSVRTHFCEKNEFKAALIGRMLRVNATDGSQQTSGPWLPDFSPFLAKEGGDQFGVDLEVPVNPDIKALSKLMALRTLANEKLNDATKARDALRAVATGAATTALEELLPEEIKDIVTAWSETLLNDIAKKAANQIGGRLRNTKLIKNDTVATLVGVDESGAKITVPAEGEGMRFYEKWSHSHQYEPYPDMATIKAYAEDGSTKDTATARAYEKRKYELNKAMQQAQERINKAMRAKAGGFKK